MLIGSLRTATGSDSGAIMVLGVMAFVAACICVALRWSPALAAAKQRETLRAA